MAPTPPPGREGKTVPEPAKAPGRRSFNEAAHKMPYPQAALRETDGEEPAIAARRGEDGAAHDVVPNAGRLVLGIGALGVVFGDIGTSPLYAEQVTFGFRAARHVDLVGVYGVVSLIFWSLMIVVSTKYAGFIMRAHNRGDGGIMALAALCRRHRVAHSLLLVTLGIFGASLFFGDGMITPAISVLSAVSGLEHTSPGVSHLVVPISIAILIGLFMVQSRGTGMVGWLFGPVTLLWFSTIAVVGLPQVLAHPGVLQALSPTWAIRFFAAHGFEAFLALGGVVLAVTGAEALYADRGHFGPAAIRGAWFLIVLPGVMLNYLGQGAWILSHPRATHDLGSFNPFFSIVPHWGQVPMVLLATAATIIASQAVISGSYSVARQAMQLGYLPRLSILHTSKLEGQIYVPVINWLLCIGVVLLVLAFKSSGGLANAYGVAVTGTFVLNTTLFLVVARTIWGTAVWRLAILGGLFLLVELSFFAANLAKILHGAWLPLAAGGAVSIVMLTWRRGRELVTANRVAKEGSLAEFLDKLAANKDQVRRVPGTAVFLSPGDETTPLALRGEVEHNHALHEKVLIVSVDTVSVPVAERDDQLAVYRVGRGLFRVTYVIIRFGYQEPIDVPAALMLARKRGLLERNLDLEGASYFVSRITLNPTEGQGMRPWRKKLFLAMARNAASPIEHFHLPAERTLSIGSQIDF